MTKFFDQARGVIEQLSPEMVWEECIAERPPRSVTGQANPEARELTGANGFKRALERSFAVSWTRHGDLASVA